MVTFDEAFSEAETAVEAEVDATTQDDFPAVGGQEEVEGSGTESGTEPSYFDLDKYGSQVVKIKVDGQEQDVPLSELRNGYMRQEAFTQKTQSLAEERQQLEAARALATAYRQNPQDTVRFLAEQAGITLAQATAVAENAEHDSWSDEGAVDDPRLAAIEQRFAELDHREARAELNRTLEALGSRYGDDFVPNEVVSRAIELQSNDLEGVYKQIAFDRMMARQDAQRISAERTQAAEDAATQSKVALAGQVSTGGSFAGAGDVGSAPVTTVSGALELAMSELGDLW